MKEKRQILAVMITMALLLIGNAHAGDVSRAFLEAVDDYQNGRYEAAAQGFSWIADSGIRNGQLYYNAGNAWFKAGDIGRAVLWYERAKHLIPNDPELAFNLSHVRSFVVDKPPQEESVLHAVFFWRQMVGQRYLVWTAVIFNGIAAAGLFWRMGLNKYLPMAVVYGCLLVVLLAGGTAGFNMISDVVWQKGVVLPAAVSVKSGVSDLSTELFVLHAGTKVTVQARQKGYCRIRFGDDKIGWVRRDVIGML